MQFKKVFTLAEANVLLPKIRSKVSRILKNATEIRKIVQSNVGVAEQARLEGLETEVNLGIVEIEDFGCYYKDWNFEVGLVDFPAELDGQLVFLCWRSDEEEISWYHPIEEGYSGREQIPSHLLGGPGSE